MDNLLLPNKYNISIYNYASSPSNTKVLKFKNKFYNNHYKIVSFSCSICDNNSDWITVGTSTEGFTWSICKKCGLLQLNKRLSPNSINEFYRSGEYQEIIIAGLNDEIHFRLKNKVMSLYFIEAIKQIGIEISEAKIFEIGCSSASILLVFKEAGAKRVRGF